MIWGLHAPLPAEHNKHGVVLILAFYVNGRSIPPSAVALFVCDDGQIRTGSIDDIRLEWRFNWTTHTWEDEDTGDLYDETGDGSPEVSGDIPEPDGADGSDPSD